MKKAHRKLIPAIAMLLVSATMLSTASFAWFSMNSTVTAEGMKVEAVSPSNLLIANNEQGTNAGATASSVITAELKLQPASTTQLNSAPNFYRVDDAAGIKYDQASAAVGTSFQLVPDESIVKAAEAVQNGVDNVVVHSFWIKDGGNEETAKTKLHVSSIDLHSSGAAISDAIRVGVVCGETGFIYAPKASGDVSTQSIKGAGKVTSIGAESVLMAGSQAISENTTAKHIASNSDVLAATVAKDSWTKVDVYIWYEGSDAACHSKNAETIDKLNISVGFACDPA